MANGHLTERTQQELSNEYQQGRAKKVFKYFCVFVPLMKVASASKELVQYNNNLEVLIVGPYLPAYTARFVEKIGLRQKSTLICIICLAVKTDV